LLFFIGKCVTTRKGDGGWLHVVGPGVRSLPFPARHFDVDDSVIECRSVEQLAHGIAERSRAPWIWDLHRFQTARQSLPVFLEEHGSFSEEFEDLVDSIAEEEAAIFYA